MFWTLPRIPYRNSSDDRIWNWAEYCGITALPKQDPTARITNSVQRRMKSFRSNHYQPNGCLTPFVIDPEAQNRAEILMELWDWPNQAIDHQNRKFGSGTREINPHWSYPVQMMPDTIPDELRSLEERGNPRLRSEIWLKNACLSGSLPYWAGYNSIGAADRVGKILSIHRLPWPVANGGRWFGVGSTVEFTKLAFPLIYISLCYLGNSAGDRNAASPRWSNFRNKYVWEVPKRILKNI